MKSHRQWTIQLPAGLPMDIAIEAIKNCLQDQDWLLTAEIIERQICAMQSDKSVLFELVLDLRPDNSSSVYVKARIAAYPLQLPKVSPESHIRPALGIANLTD